MFNIKVFPDFQPNHADDAKGHAFRKELASIRDTLAAKYVNASFHNYHREELEAVHFLTYPVSWISHYVTQFYSDADPLMKVDMRSATTIDWAQLYRSDCELKLLRTFTSRGLGKNGLTLINPIKQNFYCALSATFEISDAQWQQQKNDLIESMRFQAERISEHYCQLYLFKPAPNYKITPRECDCLYWVAMGKTDDQISDLLNIGKWTVNGHLQSAKTKLGTPSRSAAVARAIMAGIISLREVV